MKSPITETASEELTALTISQLTSALAKGEFSSSELTEAYLSRISEIDDALGAFLTLTPEIAKDAANRADNALRSENAHPLCGIPTAFKDNICTKGIRTTCASRMLENFVPPYSATVACNLESCGAVMLGKLNMDEFGMGSSCENSAFKLTVNPHAPDRVPGGSSGGCAAAVAAHELPYAIGTDTGGSIRQPAAFCGVVGIKPTYGRISRYGLVAFASSLDQIGVICRSAIDSATVLHAISAPDGMDATHRASENSLRPLPTAEELIQGGDIKGLRVGIAPEFFGSDITREIRDALNDAVKTYISLGAEITDVSIPHLSHSLPAYYVISSAEASSNLARYDGVRYGHRAQADFSSITELYKASRSEGFGDEVKRRIILGTFVLSHGYIDSYYKNALQIRELIKDEFRAAFEKCDFLLAPVTPTTAYKLGENKRDPVHSYSGDLYTVPASLAGLPAASIPCGKDKNGLPIGMQLICRPFDEATLLRAASAFEAVNLRDF
ncbi:MAG: Asp-tRNA(Asn)/Glu-tRNA(Gln) amidotransferase subunit GatA [Clostridia bacterium]|nr:Asp-tRNA(Asn)/Glu-tRNA(Gln) amidotransferase subunit GatA [Clostridia bacterium]